MGTHQWKQRAQCGESSFILVDPRAVAMCPNTGHLWVVESANRYQVERLRCLDTGVEVPLRAWEETIPAVEFSPESKGPLRVVYLVRARDGTVHAEERSIADPRTVKRTLELLSNRRSRKGANLYPPISLDWAREGVARLLGLSSRYELVARGNKPRGAPVADEDRVYVDAFESLQLRQIPMILRDELGYFLRVGANVGLFDARNGALLRQWSDAEPVAMNASTLVFLRDGHAVRLSRSTFEPVGDSADFSAARALFVTDDGTVVAQDSKGITRWWTGEHGALVCEHPTSDTLVGLARGGVEAVFYCGRSGEREDQDERAVLRGIVVIDAMPVESRCEELPVGARSILSFSDDLQSLVVRVERDGAPSLCWIRRGERVATIAITPPTNTPPKSEMCAARCSGDSLTWTAYGRVSTVAIEDEQVVERASGPLSEDGMFGDSVVRAVTDWAVFSQQNGEDKINAYAAMALKDRTMVRLVRRSSALATLALCEPVIAWAQYHDRTVGVRVVSDPEHIELSCVEANAADRVHAVALSPQGTWLAVALRSGKTLRFQRV